MQFVAHSDHSISLVNGLQAQADLVQRKVPLSSYCYNAMIDPQLKKLAFRDQSVAQQGMQWLI